MRSMKVILSLSSFTLMTMFASKQLVHEPASGSDIRWIRKQISARFSQDTVWVCVQCYCIPQVSYCFDSGLITTCVAQSSNRDRTAHDMQPVMPKSSLLKMHTVGTTILPASRQERPQSTGDKRESSRQCQLGTAHVFVFGRN